MRTCRTDAFGSPTLTEEPANHPHQYPHQYAGEVRDTETEFEWLRARHYAPELGRFISRDPLPGSLTRPQSLNRYTYCVASFGLAAARVKIGPSAGSTA